MKNKKKQAKGSPEIFEDAHPGAAKLCLILILLALAISVYLLRLHHLLAAKQSTAGMDVCSAVFGASCENALTSPAAVQFGLPLAGWGVIYFAILLSLLLLGNFLKETFAVKARATAFLISMPAAAISATLLYLMLSGHAPFCPFCATIHAINFLLVFFLKRQTGQSFGEILGSVFPASSEDPEVLQNRTAYLAYLSVALIGLASYEWVLLREAKPAVVVEKPQSSDLQKIQALLQSEEQQQIPVGPDDPVSGDASALAKLLIFSDYECPACRGYEPELSEIRQTYASKLQFVFKNFPLDKACNPIVTRDIHIHACEAAFAAEAARRQGKFWIYHDELFIADLDNPNIFDSLARSAGLDMNRFEIDRHSDAVKAKVRADIDEGVRAGVNATPTLYLNGRKILDIRPDVVHYLIDQIAAQKK